MGHQTKGAEKHMRRLDFGTFLAKVELGKIALGRLDEMNPVHSCAILSEFKPAIPKKCKTNET